MPDSWADRTFRAAFLAQLSSPEDRDVVERFGAWLARQVREAGGPTAPGQGSWMARHLQAAGQDLEATAAHLRWIGATPHDAALSPEDERLARGAASLAAQVAAHAAAIERLVHGDAAATPQPHPRPPKRSL